MTSAPAAGAPGASASYGNLIPLLMMLLTGQSAGSMGSQSPSAPGTAQELAAAGAFHPPSSSGQQAPQVSSQSQSSNGYGSSAMAGAASPMGPGTPGTAQLRNYYPNFQAPATTPGTVQAVGPPGPQGQAATATAMPSTGDSSNAFGTGMSGQQMQGLISGITSGIAKMFQPGQLNLGNPPPLPSPPVFQAAAV